MFHIPKLVSAFLALTDSLTPPTSKSRGDELWRQDPSDPSDELHELFTSVHARLRCVHRTLRGCGRGNVFASVAVLVLLTRLVARFHAAVAKHRELNLLVRFATKRSTLGKLQELHRVIDLLFRLLELTGHLEMTKWSHEWEPQCRRMYAAFAERVKKPQLAVQGLPDAKVAEIMAIMKFEIVYHENESTADQYLLLRNTFNALVRSSKVKVSKVPAFYIPSVDVEFGLPHEAIEGTSLSCVVTRSVCDQAARLVVQYLSADDRYSEQLFLGATEIWHGFQHPYVMKMVGGSHVGSEHFVVWEDVAAHGNFIHCFTNGRCDHELHRRHLWRMFLQVARGLHYIHRQGQTHGSLKCSQIVVAEDKTPKICQFELSEDSRAGALDRWKSPESNLDPDLKPSKAGDVYAFGLCIIEAFTRAIPYEALEDDDVMIQFEEGRCYPRPEDMRDDEWDVVRRFVTHNPNDRPTMAQGIDMVEELAWKEAKEEEEAAVYGSAHTSGDKP
ncbi:hypothetical protein PHYPSEUDO_002352 [Phytophthora pseudosyringae]|uniref:Protein kinase domain-containing protein n=1 Tax=Phytophthora pseudosyringae TaxID=221518 RepID=A0A8T1VU06_9STRA|nr:hypothetical protein PHYPSEUDO_002352 [Phytophthora pseudosyringae]